MRHLSSIMLAGAMLFAFATQLQAQGNKTNFTFKKVGTFDPKNAGPDFAATLQSLEAPAPGGDSYRSFLMEQKRKQRELHPIRRGAMKEKRGTNDVQDLILGQNFGTNHYLFDVPLIGGRPNDNTLAISNGGMVLASYNTSVWGFDVLADTFLFTAPFKAPSFGQFASDLTLSFPFDPKLLYDPISDRFILVFLSGRGPTDSEIIVCFSSSNYPTDPWNVYAITGNPHMDNTWTDYPAIAITEDELFITVNLLRENEPWQTGFSETLIWQVDLDNGYDGDPTLTTRLWDGIELDGIPLRNLNPIQGGLEPVGPNIYFLSNRNFELSNDSIFVVEVTGNLADNTAQANVSVGITNTPYGAPPEANQPQGHKFDTNDGRVLGGFILDDKIQFVGNTINTQTGLAAVYHGFIDDIDGTPVFTGNIVGHNEQDYGYPNIAYSGLHGDSDKSVIVFDHSSPTDFAGYSAIHYSNSEYSEVLTVVEGEDIVDRIGGTYERWGDYSGIQRKYDEPGKTWMAAYYSYIGGNNSTWVAEITNSVDFPSSVKENVVEHKSATTYPNPTIDRVNVVFEIAESKKVTFELYSLNGQLVQNLGYGTAKTGKNEFSFSTVPLSEGIYMLQVKSGGKQLFQERIVKSGN